MAQVSGNGWGNVGSYSKIGTWTLGFWATSVFPAMFPSATSPKAAAAVTTIRCRFMGRLLIALTSTRIASSKSSCIRASRAVDNPPFIPARSAARRLPSRPSAHTATRRAPDARRGFAAAVRASSDSRRSSSIFSLNRMRSRWPVPGISPVRSAPTKTSPFHFGKLVAGVERHARHGDRRHPVHDRRLEAFVRQAVPPATGPDRCARSSRAASRSSRPA